jgi:1-acyl-sn-glycerol-3-phosphate acyltransferase
LDKAKRRHVRVYKFFRFILGPFIRLLFNYRYERFPEIDGPCIVLANHNSDWDPIYVALASRKHMYFVASEHTFHWGLLSRLLRRYFAPIARMKGTTDTVSAINILRHLRQGANVCIFAEGNRSWDGRTCPIHPSIGKLVRTGGAALITYKLIGGYLTSPRWSTHQRRGRLEGRLVGVYPPEETRSMSPDEIMSLVERDLHEDAYARQETEMVAYRGRRMAEKLETAIYMCPKCGGIDTMKSENNRFSCSCGFELLYNKYGFFEGDDVPFRTVAQWDDWQTKRLADLAEDHDLVLSNEDTQLYQTYESHLQTEVTRGRLCLSRNALTVGDRRFPLSSVNKMDLFSRQGLVFSSGGNHFEVKSSAVFCARKYLIFWKLLKGREKVPAAK